MQTLFGSCTNTRQVHVIVSHTRMSHHKALIFCVKLFVTPPRDPSATGFITSEVTACQDVSQSCPIRARVALSCVSAIEVQGAGNPVLRFRYSTLHTPNRHCFGNNCFIEFWNFHLLSPLFR